MSGDALIEYPPAKPHFEVIPVTVTHGEVRYDGYVRRLTWTRNRAFWMGNFVLFVVYAAGTMSWLNPITHYLVPPIWVIGGPWGAYKVYKMYKGQVTFRSGKGRCPLCHEMISLRPHQSRFPFTATCSRCRDEFHGDQRDWSSGQV